MDMPTNNDQMRWQALADRIEAGADGPDRHALVDDLAAALKLPMFRVYTAYANLEYAMRLCHWLLPQWRERIANESPDMAPGQYLFRADLAPPGGAPADWAVCAAAATPARAVMAALCRGIAKAGLADTSGAAPANTPFGS